MIQDHLNADEVKHLIYKKQNYYYFKKKTTKLSFSFTLEERLGLETHNFFTDKADCSLRSQARFSWEGKIDKYKKGINTSTTSLSSSCLYFPPIGTLSCE